MKKTFNTPEDFYKNAMISIQQVLGSKLRTLGVTIDEIPELVANEELNRYTSDIVDGIILEMYEYRGIKLLEVEWTGNSVKQRDINKDEREFDREIL